MIRRSGSGVPPDTRAARTRYNLGAVGVSCPLPRPAPTRNAPRHATERNFQ